MRGRRLALGVACVGVFAAWVASQLPANEDVVWFLVVTTDWLRTGALYGPGMLEVNPPAIVLWCAPAVAFAERVGMDATVAWRGFVVAVGLLSLGLSTRLLPQACGEERRDLKGSEGLVVWGLASLLLLGVGRHFGQREHVMAIAAVPYLLLIAARSQGVRIGAGLSTSVGLLGACGWALKPQAVVVPLLLEVWLVIRHRGTVSRVRAEVVAIVAVFAIYGAVVFQWFPSYVRDVLPHVVASYRGLGAGISDLLMGSGLVVLIPAAALAFAFRRSPAAAWTTCGSLAMLGYVIVYFVQGKGWAYHRLPGLLAAGFVGLAAWIPSMSHRVATRWAGIAVLLLTTAATAGPSWGGALHRAWTHTPSPDARLEAALRPLAQGRLVYVFSTRIRGAFPWLQAVEGRWASRLGCLWPLPAIVQAGQPMSSELQATDEWMRRIVVEDLVMRQPELVMVDRHVPRWFPQGATFDYFAYFGRDPRFAAWRSRYERRTDVEGFEIYVRRTG